MVGIWQAESDRNITIDGFHWVCVIMMITTISGYNTINQQLSVRWYTRVQWSRPIRYSIDLIFEFEFEFQFQFQFQF